MKWERFLHGTCPRVVLIALFAALWVCAYAMVPATDEAANALLVGNWYGEMACNNCGERDYLRWTRLNSADGTQRVHFRYYWKGNVQQNVLRFGHWGYRAGVYWLTCEAYYVDGQAQPCPDTRYDFVVEALGPQSMTYYNQKYDVRYTARRVGGDFRLDDLGHQPSALVPQ